MTEAPKDAIARVAGRLFAERGFTATSVRAIAAGAGVDPALVIRHFGSKEALFAVATERIGDHIEETRFDIKPDDVAGAVEYVVNFPGRGCPVVVELQPLV